MTPLRRAIDLLTAIAALCLLLCALPAAASTGRHEIAFIDSGVPDAQILADGIRPGVEVVRLDAGRDGVVQMAEVLAGRRDVQAIPKMHSREQAKHPEECLNVEPGPEGCLTRRGAVIFYTGGPHDNHAQDI